MFDGLRFLRNSSPDSTQTYDLSHLNDVFFSGDQRMKIEVEELTPALRRGSSSLSSSLKSQHLYTPSPALGRPHTLIPSSPLLVIDSQTEPYTPRAPGFNIYQSYPNKIPGINKYESNLESNNYTSQSFPEDLGLNLQDEYCLMERKQDNTKPKPDLIENRQFKSESSKQDYTLQDQVKLAKDQDYILQDQVKLAKDQDYILQDQVKLAKDQDYTLQDQVKLAKDQEYTLQDQVKLAKDQEYTLQNQVKLAKDQEYTLQEQVKLAKDQEYTLQDQRKLAKDQEYTLQDQVKLAKDQEYILQDQVKLAKDQQYILQDQVKLVKDQDYILQDQVKLANDQDYILQDQVKLAKDQEYKIKEDKTEDAYNMTNNVSKRVIDEYYVMDSSLPENEDYCIMETTKKNEMKNRKNPDEYCLMEKKSQGMNVIIPPSDKTKPTDQDYCTMFPKSVPTKPNHLNLSGLQTKSSKLGLTLFTATSVPQGSSFQSNLSPISPQPFKLDRGTGDEAGLQFEYTRSGSPSRSYLENRRVSFSPDSEPKSKSRVDLQVLKDSILQVLIGQYDTGTSRTVYYRF